MTSEAVVYLFIAKQTTKTYIFQSSQKQGRDAALYLQPLVADNSLASTLDAMQCMEALYEYATHGTPPRQHRDVLLPICSGEWTVSADKPIAAVLAKDATYVILHVPMFEEE